MLPGYDEGVEGIESKKVLYVFPTRVHRNRIGGCAQGGVAQLEERLSHNQQVVGSRPTPATTRSRMNPV